MAASTVSLKLERINKLVGSAIAPVGWGVYLLS